MHLDVKILAKFYFQIFSIDGKISIRRRLGRKHARNMCHKTFHFIRLDRNLDIEIMNWKAEDEREKSLFVNIYDWRNSRASKKSREDFAECS